MKVRVIPTILVDQSTVVKGQHFSNWRTVGNVYSVAKLLAVRDVDEIILLDTRATEDSRSINPEFIKNFVAEINVPFGVGGGIKSMMDAKTCIRSGAEKVILGDVVFGNPNIVSEISDELGSQAVTVAVDVGVNGFVYRRSGKEQTNMNALDFALEMQNRGAGEILLQSINRDGTMTGYDIPLLELIMSKVNVPVLSSGGAGKPGDFLEAAQAGAAGLCAGALFQFTQYTPRDIREFLRNSGIRVRNST